VLPRVIETAGMIVIMGNIARVRTITAHLNLEWTSTSMRNSNAHGHSTACALGGPGSERCREFSLNGDRDNGNDQSGTEWLVA
jgi:hypothetical protein